MNHEAIHYTPYSLRKVVMECRDIRNSKEKQPLYVAGVDGPTALRGNMRFSFRGKKATKLAGRELTRLRTSGKQSGLVYAPADQPEVPLQLLTLPGAFTG